jgi:predicted dehydrogenase
MKAAIVGTGFMGAAHIEALRRLGIAVAGVLGSAPGRGRAFAQRQGLARAYEDIEELLADPEVEAVHLCTPNYLHYPAAKAALEAGRHVLCEKPLAMSSAQAAELVGLAHAGQRVGAVCYNLRFYPMNQEAHARIQAGEIGVPRIVHAEYCQDWLFLPTDWNWRLVPEQGGEVRAVGDIGTHVLDMLQWLTGLQVTEVMADLTTFIPTRYKPSHPVETFAGKLGAEEDAEEVEIRTEDMATMLLHLEQGARGAVTLSQISAGRKNKLWWEIDGSEGSLAWCQERPNELWVGHRNRPNEVLLKDPALMQPAARRYAAYPGGHAEGYPDTFVRLFSDVYRTIESGSAGRPLSFATFEDGWKELLLCEAILSSSRERSWVQVAAG